MVTSEQLNSKKHSARNGSVSQICEHSLDLQPLCLHKAASKFTNLYLNPKIVFKVNFCVRTKLPQYFCIYTKVVKLKYI